MLQQVSDISFTALLLRLVIDSLGLTESMIMKLKGRSHSGADLRQRTVNVIVFNELNLCLRSVADTSIPMV